MAVGITQQHPSQANAILFAMAMDLPYIYLQRKHQGTKTWLSLTEENTIVCVLTHCPQSFLFWMCNVQMHCNDYFHEHLQR